MASASNHGGRRPGAGKRRQTETEIPAALAEQFAEWAEQDFQKLYAAVADRAFGHYVIVKKDHRGRPPASPLPPEDLVTADGEEVRGYWIQGDAAAQKILIEQLLGRAGAKSQTQAETTIILQTNVPRPPPVTGDQALPFGLPLTSHAPAEPTTGAGSSLIQELIDGAECL